MKRMLTLLVAATIATGTLSLPASAEMAKESTTDKVKAITLAQWRKLQAEYRKDKAKYTACNDKAKADKLRGRKRWGAIYQCMTAG
jgi:hypothetical protein